IDDPDLPVTPRHVMVLRNAGPIGAPGMPEAGALPIPKKLGAAGVADMVRISDARMSGTAFGTVVLHVAPEAAVGGPLGAVRSGDPIVLDVPASRLAALAPPESKYRRGYGRLYLDHILQANEGCDFDFLRHVPGEESRRE